MPDTSAPAPTPHAPPDQAARRRTIALLALPIVAGMVSQNITNLIDTALMGFVGATAVAAVGIASFANFMCSAAITGLAAGVQAMAARRKGEGRDAETAIPLNGGLFLSAVIGLPLSLLLIFLAPQIFQLLSDDPAVREIGVPYLQARMAGMMGLGMNFAFRGFWNGISRPGIYMRTIIAIHVAQISLSIILVFGYFDLPALGALGAGIGTTLSVYIGTLLYTGQGVMLARKNGFLERLPRLETIKTIFSISIPASIQQLAFSAGFTVLFAIIGRIGTNELAAASVLLNISQTAFLPGLGLGLAAASLVGQALGRGDPADAKAWGWQVARIGIVVMAIIGLPMVLLPTPILGVFLKDAAVIELARLPLQLAGSTIMIEAVAIIILNALQGAGATKTVAKFGVGLQWGLMLPIAYVIGPLMGFGLFAVWAWFIFYRFIAAALFAWVWQYGRWQNIKL
ncbi:MAG: MATE family efflux transporter [Rhodospirillaceae bacterium]|nr:MATE family efflux transporter [Rhodospirillaceae bacterium]